VGRRPDDGIPLRESVNAHIQEATDRSAQKRKEDCQQDFHSPYSDGFSLCRQELPLLLQNLMKSQQDYLNECHSEQSEESAIPPVIPAQAGIQLLTFLSFWRSPLSYTSKDDEESRGGQGKSLPFHRKKRSRFHNIVASLTET